MNNLCSEAQKILSDLKLKLHHDYLDSNGYYTAYYSVDGCDELLEINEYNFSFLGVKINFFGLPNADTKFNQVTAAKMIKLFIEEYLKHMGEQNIGAYI